MDPTYDFPYPEDEGQTHHEFCWRLKGHHNCAVKRIYDLQAQLDANNETIDGAKRSAARLADLLEAEMRK